MKLQIGNYQASLVDWWLRYLSCETAIRWMLLELTDDKANIGSGNVWAPSGNKPLSDPMLTLINDAIWRHLATMSYRTPNQIFVFKYCLWLVKHTAEPIFMELQHTWPYHEDVITWKHLPHYWPFMREVHLSQVDSPHNTRKGQYFRALVFSL